MESWIFLLVGGLGAVGAALSLGTLAAWVRFERTGEVPGQGAEDAPGPGSHVRRRLLVRIVIGAVVAAVCFVSLADQGLLGGPALG